MTQKPHGLSRYETLVKHCADVQQTPLPATFGRVAQQNPLSGDQPNGQPFDAQAVLNAFDCAVDSMKDEMDPGAHDVAAGMTFFGQFVDHDITLDATSAIGTVIDPSTIRNIRTPSLDLDCVYGDGPEASPHLYHPKHHGFLLFGNAANIYDLARTWHGTALIGDPRNDENQIVSQLQGAFICLHNILMTALEPGKDKQPKIFADIRAAAKREFKDISDPFPLARKICRLHYQYLVKNDLLPAFVNGGVLENVKRHLAAGKLPAPFNNAAPVMPIEFSGAAYRFGHATVQSKYQINHENLEFDLFQLGRSEFSYRPPSLNVAFTKLFDYPGKDSFQKARPIGRKMAASIFSLPFISGTADIGGAIMSEAQNRKLPLRDRLTLELASGQQIARTMGVDELPAPKELTAFGITKTPLWYYCLQEAESHGGRLGQVGGTIVATVLLRLLYLSPESLICSAHNFNPWVELGAAKSGNYAIGHMLKFVEENRDNIAHAADLRTIANPVSI